MPTKTRDHPVVIGLVGDSGAGKTTYAAGLAEVLGAERTVNICIDDYHRYHRAERALTGITPHDPACNYMDILEQHVALLRNGHPILKPVYNHCGGTLEAPEYVEPKTFIILEGLLGYATPALRDIYDIRFFLEPQEQLRIRWKFQRDITQGAYSREQVMASVDRLKDDSERYVMPQRAFADMVIRFYPPDDHPEAAGEDLNVAHILRPTLPYLDLSPILEAGRDGGLLLELARDVDGRPVDALHIFGALDDARAHALGDILGNLIPFGPPDRSRIGLFAAADMTIHQSHPLSLSQLLIAHYLLNVAFGEPDT